MVRSSHFFVWTVYPTNPELASAVTWGGTHWDPGPASTVVRTRSKRQPLAATNVALILCMRSPALLRVNQSNALPELLLLQAPERQEAKALDTAERGIIGAGSQWRGGRRSWLPLQPWLSPSTWYFFVNAPTWLNVAYCARAQLLKQTSLNSQLIGAIERILSEISGGRGGEEGLLIPILFSQPSPRRYPSSPVLIWPVVVVFLSQKGPFLHSPPS